MHQFSYLFYIKTTSKYLSVVKAVMIIAMDNTIIKIKSECSEQS